MFTLKTRSETKFIKSYLHNPDDHVFVVTGRPIRNACLTTLPMEYYIHGEDTLIRREIFIYKYIVLHALPDDFF